MSKLEKELMFLTKEELKKELDCYSKYFETGDANNIIESLGTPKELSKKIYLKRGIDPSKLSKNFINNIATSFTDIINAYKNKNNDSKKMTIDLIYILLILILIKLPFNLVRDISFDYISIISTNPIFEKLWYLLFLLLYTLTAISSFVVLVRNFSKKYIH